MLKLLKPKDDATKWIQNCLKKHCAKGRSELRGATARASPPDPAQQADNCHRFAIEMLMRTGSCNHGPCNFNPNACVFSKETRYIIRASHSRRLVQICQPVTRCLCLQGACASQSLIQAMSLVQLMDQTPWSQPQFPIQLLTWQSQARKKKKKNALTDVKYGEKREQDGHFHHSSPTTSAEMPSHRSALK